jgi:TP901 family phage tail tape measure protein
MREVFTLMPGMSQDAMGAMTDDVKKFATDFGVLPEKVVPALYQSLSAGVPPDNVFAFLEKANKLGVAGAADTTQAVDLLSTVTKGYGDTSQEAYAKASDLALLTVQLGKTTIPELGASMGKVVPIAAALGVSQVDLAASYATLTGVTGNTAEVTTQMGNVLKGLLNPNAEMTKSLHALGFETGAAAIESLGLQGTLEALRGTTGGSDAQLAKMLGTSEALTGVLAITGSQADIFKEKQKALGEAAENAGEVTEAAYSTMSSGVGQAAKDIAAKIGVMALDIGEKFQSLGPLFTAFGPTMGRLLGAGLGGAAGFVLPKVAKLAGSIGGVMVDGIKELGSQIGDALGVAWDAAKGLASRAVGLAGQAASAG